MEGVGDSINAKNAKWSFDGEVVNYFENHISRSVPFYKEGHDLILEISDYFIKQDSITYELGCSTGILSYKLSKRFVIP